MIQEKICLASDNFSPTHPLVMEAILEANQGYAFAYGSDAWTKQAEELIREEFKSSPKVLIVPNGTGANVLALKIACRRQESVICTDIAHINTQETGAAEAVVGCKLLTVPHKNGKLSPESVLSKLKQETALGKHATSPRVLSITQPTEAGTVYTLKELDALVALCKQQRLFLHIDGSRLYNAAVHLNVSLDAFRYADLLSLGGTKNGLMGAEALLIFNEALHEGAEYLHKQSLLLISKMRYLSAQYLPFFRKKLWHALAGHANQKAQEIAEVIKATPGLSLSYPVETNQIFFTAPPGAFAAIQDKIICYPWDEAKNELRFIASWNTTEKEVEAVRLLFSTLPLS